MNRIKLLSSLTLGSKIVCDIGCDHAYVLIDAIRNYSVEKGLACDIAQGPLDMAKKSIVAANLENKIKLCLSNGFDNVSDDFDTAVIAGMGGSLIVDILNKGMSKLENKKIILQPNNDRYKVRMFLAQKHFKIIEEYAIIDEKKYYEIIVATFGNASYDNYDLKYGPILRKNKSPENLLHYQEKLEQLRRIVPNIKDEKQKEEKLKEIEELLHILGD